MSTKKQISQKPAKNTRTTGWNTNRPASRPAPSAKTTSRPVKAQFKAGKDL